MQLPNCPKCNSEYAYEDNGMFICPECAHEWNDNEAAAESDELIVKDANGNLLADGDSVTVIKDLIALFRACGLELVFQSTFFVVQLATLLIELALSVI